MMYKQKSKPLQDSWKYFSIGENLNTLVGFPICAFAATSSQLTFKLFFMGTHFVAFVLLFTLSTPASTRHINVVTSGKLTRKSAWYELNNSGFKRIIPAILIKAMIRAYVFGWAIHLTRFMVEEIYDDNIVFDFWPALK